MKRDEPFYNEFLSELKALDNFLLGRQRKDRYVERTDPDVRRLMESMAFFSARSRQLAVDGFGAAVLRLARGHLDELLRAQPSRALVQAVTDARLVEPVVLARDTSLRFQVERPARVAARLESRPIVGRFSSTCAVTLLPMQVQSARLGLRAASGFRILVELRAHQPIGRLAEPLSFHISLLDDYRASRALLHALEHHLQDVSVVFDDSAPEPDASGLRCRVAFGCHPIREFDEHLHPLAAVSRFFHFPEEELFLHIYLPEREGAWSRAWLCLDVSEDWPTSMIVNKDVFQLFVIPSTNARREPAEPFMCDGTKDRYPLHPVSADVGDALHRVVGVYREVESGWQPILPEHLAPIAADGSATYALEARETEDGEGQETELLLDIPDAFDTPCKIAVDACFHQPWFDEYVGERMRVFLQTRKIEGAGWQVRGPIREHRASRISEKPFEVLHLLALMGKSTLSLHEIQYILGFVGADEGSLFGEVVDTMVGLRITEGRTPAGDGIEYVYHVQWKETEEDVSALRQDLMEKLGMLLDAWSRSPVRVLSEGDADGGEVGYRPLKIV